MNDTICDLFLDKRTNIDKFWKVNSPTVLPTPQRNFKLYRTEKDGSYKYLYMYNLNSALIDLKDIKTFFDFLHAIPTDSKGKSLLPLYINLDGAKFADKLVYIIFETAILYLINNKKWLVSIEGSFEPENCSNGVQICSLAQGNWPISEMDNADFDSKMLNWNRMRIEKYKYNRVETDSISLSRYFVNNTNGTNNVASDIYEFLEKSTVLQKTDTQTIGEIANTILEIKDNCAEHTNSPYIYDIDIKKVVHGDHSELDGRDYIAINVGIWDFSNVRLGDAIKEKIHIIESPNSTKEQVSGQMGRKTEVFQKLLEVRDIHKNFLNDDYTYDDFFALSAFQPGVTGRNLPGSTGGAGLSHVLDFLIDYSDNYKCYCLTGDTIINLDRKFLYKDDKNWYAFNDTKECLFTNSKPSTACVSRSPLFYPGTAFFLHLELN
jgi:hypothetical protein